MSLRQLALAWAAFLLGVVGVPTLLAHAFPGEEPCKSLETYNGGITVCR